MTLQDLELNTNNCADAVRQSAAAAASPALVAVRHLLTYSLLSTDPAEKRLT